VASIWQFVEAFGIKWNLARQPTSKARRVAPELLTRSVNINQPSCGTHHEAQVAWLGLVHP
jgi:hypothetical protein